MHKAQNIDILWKFTLILMYNAACMTSSHGIPATIYSDKEIVCNTNKYTRVTSRQGEHVNITVCKLTSSRSDQNHRTILIITVINIWISIFYYSDCSVDFETFSVCDGLVPPSFSVQSLPLSTGTV